MTTRTVVTITIKPIPEYRSPGRALVTVEHEGRVYGARYAVPWPTKELVREIWDRDCRLPKRYRELMPYDPRTGTISDWE